VKQIFLAKMKNDEVVCYTYDHLFILHIFIENMFYIY